MKEPKKKVMSRAEELKILQKQAERIQKDPQIGVRIAQRAGIMDKDGNYTGRYKQSA